MGAIGKRRKARKMRRGEWTRRRGCGVMMMMMMMMDKKMKQKPVCKTAGWYDKILLWNIYYLFIIV